MTREEVDTEHLGIVGNSGGGTMTTWLCGVEPRFTMAAPSCFVTTMRRNLENEEPQDTEQCPPNVLAHALDHADFLAASAPDPIIILAKEKDFFDIRGARETYAQLRRLYGLLDAEDKIGFFAGEGTHGFTQDNREAMYRWFNAVTGARQSSEEPPIELEDDATLYCTPSGQVAELGSETVFAFTSAKAKRLSMQRIAVPREGALQAAVREVLRLPDPMPAATPDFRVLKSVRGSGYPKPRHARYAVETEPGIHALVYRLGDEPLPAPPPQSGAPAILYAAHISSDYELRHEPLLRELLADAPDAVLYTCDVRGIGESRPSVGRRDSFLEPYGSDYMHAIHAIMLDAPVPGRRTLDLLRVIRWLKAFGHGSLHVAATGWGCIPAAFAAHLSEDVGQVTLKGAPASYRAIAQTELYEWPLAAFVPNILTRFDLPDIYTELERKGLALV